MPIHGCATGALHASLRPAILQPWGAWAFAYADVDGRAIHCVDWAVRQPSPDAAYANPRTGRTE